ncbi:transglycosylase domain-containing protein [Octadecabacter sp. CECT 8868]|uniref:transglycosylase domain-containing protein n=1 Tax=Octadecabacter algicola TaxID=2909342 RepID=UPI001F42FF89|nr:transglycosylase domain-containing protein [Octadecabacter algicola]MCF2903588.1 transglycosylase domain-containing protein [Octadecabacter algicola]
MIRLIAFACLFAVPAHSEELNLPDVTHLRNSDLFDLSAVPPLIVQQAIAASEDRDYFETFPAFSPISQAVVRNFLVSPQRTLTAKAMEIRLAADLANEFTPEEIMTMYAEHVYLGAGCYGFSDALEHRMGTRLEQATLAQVLTLATLLRAPMMFESHPDRLPPRYNSLAVQGVLMEFWDADTSRELTGAGPAEILPNGRCLTE